MTLEDKLVDDLVVDEAYRRFPYRDTTGHLTVGIGRNLDDKGISLEEAKYLCKNDVKESIESVHKNISWSIYAPDNVKLVLYNMAFNLGIEGLLKFKVFLSQLEKGDYTTAANTLLYKPDNNKTLYYTQVKSRAERLAKYIVSGVVAIRGFLRSLRKDSNDYAARSMPNQVRWEERLAKRLMDI